MSKIKKVTAQVDFSVDVDCPGCGHQLDALDGDDDNVVTGAFFDNTFHGWKDLGIEMECGECGCEFILDELEY